MRDSISTGGKPSTTVCAVLHALALHPIETIVRRWNWKSALLSSIVRALIFFGVNLAAGPRAALAAFFTELAFRGAASGFYGALTEAFRFAEPEWAASLVAVLLLPLCGHSVEFVIHLLRGTVKLRSSVGASVCFTAVSTLFNLYAMRRGALVTGEGHRSLGQDLRSVPGLVAGFLAAAPLAVWRFGVQKLIFVAQPPLPTRPDHDT